MRSLTKLRVLVLSDTMIGDAAMLHVRHVPYLCLERTRITDEGVAVLSGSGQLEWIVLSGTDVTDVGIATLQNTPSLRSLYVPDTKVSDEGIESLQKANPKLSIIRTLRRERTSSNNLSRRLWC